MRAQLLRISDSVGQEVLEGFSRLASFPTDDGSLSFLSEPTGASYLSLNVTGQDAELLAKLPFGSIHPSELPHLPPPRVRNPFPWEQHGWKSALHVSSGYVSSTYREVESSLYYRAAIQFGFPLYPSLGGRGLLSGPPLDCALHSDRQCEHMLLSLHMQGIAGSAYLSACLRQQRSAA